MAFKTGDQVVYFGSQRKLYKSRGIIQDRFGQNRWRVQLECGFVIFAADNELSLLQQTLDDYNERYLDDLM